MRFRMNLPNDTHRSTHQRLASVVIASNEVEDVENGLNVLLEGLGCGELVIATDQRVVKTYSSG